MTATWQAAQGLYPAAVVKQGTLRSPRQRRASSRARCAAGSELSNCSLERTQIEQQYFREVGGGALIDFGVAAPSSFYELLGVDSTAEPSEIKQAYRALQRIAHPDIAGERANVLATLLNSAIATLSDPAARQRYDADLHQFQTRQDTFDGQPVSSWHGGAGEDKAAFVDEVNCIGCTQCTSFCPNTFQLEPIHGRARVQAQWADDPEVIAEAVDLCPVDCIHFVRRDQLALLEWVMKDCHREDAAILARRRSGNMGAAPNSNSPFDRAEVFMRHRKKAQESLVQPRKYSAHTSDLAAAIAGAWVNLPPSVRAKGWPQWLPEAQQAPAGQAAKALGADSSSLGFAPGFEWMTTGF